MGATDSINPLHYKQHPSGVECITITEGFNFNLGNAIKYIWRAGLKSSNSIEDLKKAKWYIEREIQRCTIAAGDGATHSEPSVPPLSEMVLEEIAKARQNARAAVREALYESELKRR